MTAFNMGLLSLYRRELAAEKELKQPNFKLITALQSEINKLQS